jgi:hypothetical protein
VRHLELTGVPPEVLVVLDADCVAQPGALAALAARVAATGARRRRPT